MKMFARSAVAIAFFPGVVWADSDFGTKEEARSMADLMIEIVEEQGLEAAVRAMHENDMPFVGSRMGVNLFEGSTVIADNREPETIAADYSQTADLTGALVWPLISAAAATEGDAELKWYHYDTQEEYDYKCHSKSAQSMDVTVMVCR